MEPRYRIILTESGVAHLILEGAAGPPWMPLCGRSVVGRLLAWEGDLVTPCPSCYGARRHRQGWKRTR